MRFVGQNSLFPKLPPLAYSQVGGGEQKVPWWIPEANPPLCTEYLGVPLPLCVGTCKGEGANLTSRHDRRTAVVALTQSACRGVSQVVSGLVPLTAATASTGGLPQVGHLGVGVSDPTQPVTAISAPQSSPARLPLSHSHTPPILSIP